MCSKIEYPKHFFLQTGRIDFQCCKVIGHTGQILDLKWNPFNDNIIASASDDCTVIFVLHCCENNNKKKFR